MVTATSIPDAAIEAFRTGLRGELLQPGDAGYDTARRLWNGMIDKRPALIARCSGVADVIRAVTFARERNLLVAVRGGGHGVAGRAMCDGGLVIDLSPMKGIRVDPAARTARAEAGVLWGEFDRETQVFGLATTGGAISTTGIAGLTLGGGCGWLMRTYGLTVDNLLSVDLVTADGRFLTAGAGENADLFWGVRGGGGNFGIVTSFEYELHPVGPVILGGLVLYPLAQAEAVLRFYREFTQSAPDEVMTYALLVTSPDGAPMAALAACYVGPVEAGEAALRPLRSCGTPAADLIGPTPYSLHQTLFDAAFPAGRFDYEKSTFLNVLSDELIGTLVAHFRRVPSPFTGVLIEHHGGAIRRVPEDATAFRHRAPEYNLTAPSAWTDPADSETNIRWTRELLAAVQPFSTGEYYANYNSDTESEEHLRAAYGTNYSRLAALKAKYDPTNFFRLNHNVQPGNGQ